MKFARFGPYRRILLLGGGQVLMTLAEELRSRGTPVQILTSPRLAQERWEAAGFEEAMRCRGFPLWVQETLDLSKPPLLEIDASTLGLSLGAAWIFQPNVIHRFDGNLINCHPSCLPEDRGGGGFSWRIMRGDRRGQCALHRVDAGVDSGEIICQNRFTFSRRCRIPRDFFEEQYARELPFLLEFIRKTATRATLPLRTQDPARATYWPRLETSLHGAIDWGWSVQEVERFVCAFDEPYVGAFTYVYDRRIHLKDCQRVNAVRGSHPFLSGLIYRIDGGRFYVAGQGGDLSFGQANDSQGRSVLASLRVGDRLWTPADEMEKARSVRVFHSSTGRHYRSCELAEMAVSP